MGREQYYKVLSKLKGLLTDKKSQQALEHLKDQLAELPDDTPTPEKGDYPLPPEVTEIGGFALFSDGACRGNPGPGAWGVMAQDYEGTILFESSGLDTATTNNRMELYGAIQSLLLLKEHFSFSPEDEEKPVFLYSDSKYVVDGIEKWVPGWKKRGWKKADGKSPENIELWKELFSLSASFPRLKFVWVKGHSGHPQNERVDQLANLALDESGF